MSTSDNTSGWQKVEIKDSFVMFPLTSLPDPIRTEALNSMDGYKLVFDETQIRKRPKDASHVLLPDYLAEQPLHVFCTVGTNFDENAMTLVDAIAHDRARATQELQDLHDATVRQDTKEFLRNLDIIEKIVRDGQETAFSDDVLGLIPDDFKNGNKPAQDKGVKYVSLTYNGFRPAGL